MTGRHASWRVALCVLLLAASAGVDRSGTASAALPPSTVVVGLAQPLNIHDVAAAELTSFEIAPNGDVYVGGYGAIYTMAANGDLTRVVGTGLQGFSGDGGSAATARISFPVAMTFDSTGALYFHDGDNARIRKVALNGTITTLAGNGAHDLGLTGIGGPATSSPFYGVRDLAVDSIGNIYVSFSVGGMAKVDASGVLSVFAGGFPAQCSGIGGPAASVTMAGSTSVEMSPSGDVVVALACFGSARDRLVHVGRRVERAPRRWWARRSRRHRLRDGCELQ